jgi:hypothetical protein
LGQGAGGVLRLPIGASFPSLEEATMCRKVSLLILTGTLCLLAGAFTGPLVADDCNNEEPDRSLLCPIQKADDPKYKCTDYTSSGKDACNKSGYGKDAWTNEYFTTYSKGYFAMPLLAGNPPLPQTTPCYTRVKCKWDDTKGTCVDGDLETVWQWWLTKWQCPPTEG